MKEVYLLHCSQKGRASTKNPPTSMKVNNNTEPTTIMFFRSNKDADKNRPIDCPTRDVTMYVNHIPKNPYAVLLRPTMKWQIIWKSVG